MSGRSHGNTQSNRKAGRSGRVPHGILPTGRASGISGGDASGAFQHPETSGQDSGSGRPVPAVFEAGTRSQPAHSFDQPQKGVTLSYGRDGQCPDMDAKIETLEELGSADDYIEFVYIFDQDQVWKYFQGGYLEEGLRDVKEDLEALENGIDVIKPPPFDFLDEFPEDWPEDDSPQEGMVMTGM